MKIKDIIKILNTLNSANDFIATNGDGDQTNGTKELLNELSDCRKILKQEKTRIYLNNAKQTIKRLKL